MNIARFIGWHDLLTAFVRSFRSRDIFIHDGVELRRVHLSARIQIGAVATSLFAIVLLVSAAVQIAIGTPVLAGAAITSNRTLLRMSAKVRAMDAEMQVIRGEALAHAKRLDARQAMLDAVVAGKAVMPASYDSGSRPVSPRIGVVLAPLAMAEGHQDRLASRLAASAEARYRQTTAMLDHMGLKPGRFHQVAGASGGPYEAVTPASAVPSSKSQSDSQFRALFQSWKRLEQLQQGIVAIPSQRPTNTFTFTSGFGVRSDPFKGTAAMHAGVDMPGPIGTPIYATADGVVSRAGWCNGYGNLVELDHGRGIQTRYGHLSAVLVQPGMRIARGQLIARMGSTGRSTGSHLHYEVRLDGHAVNPMPFLQSANYLLAMQTGHKVAMGGPIGAASGD